jgi:addiction module HigA family antidote
MLELTKKQTTEGFADFCIRVPRKDAARVHKALLSMLEFAEIPVRQLNEEGEELLSFEEIFPDHHPGETVRGFRLREELTQAALAEKIGVRQHHISEIENGKRSISLEMAKKLASVLGTDHRVFL